jgi:hypothetical protein
MMASNESLMRLLDTTPESLARLQLDGIKDHTVNILKRVIFLIEKGYYGDIGTMLVRSPAGDCMGTDHHFIDFSWNPNSDDGLDIAEVVELLEQLQSKVDSLC